MNDFRTMPTVLRAQREELEAVHQELCRNVSEISGVIRQLNAMSGFDGVIQNLRRVQQTGGEQEAKLRQSARVLEQVAELYTRTELRNLDCGVSTAPAARTVREAPKFEPTEMLPDPQALFGMEVFIPQRDGGG